MAAFLSSGTSLLLVHSKDPAVKIVEDGKVHAQKES
jgi:hypothetical protein